MWYIILIGIIIYLLYTRAKAIRIARAYGQAADALLHAHRKANKDDIPAERLRHTINNLNISVQDNRRLWETLAKDAGVLVHYEGGFVSKTTEDRVLASLYRE
jgi:hypothetical protein